MNLNKKLVSRTITLLVLLTIVAGSVVEISAQRRRTRRSRRTVTRVVTPPVQYYTVPADTVIRVRMDTELNSRTARVGDRYDRAQAPRIWNQFDFSAKVDRNAAPVTVTVALVPVTFIDSTRPPHSPLPSREVTVMPTYVPIVG